MIKYNRFNLGLGRRLFAISLLFTALVAMPSVISAQSLGFMDSIQTSGDGGTIEQVANTMVFPAFEGELKPSGSLAVAAIEDAEFVRSVKVLVAYDVPGARLFTLRAGDTTISASVSDSSLSVIFGIGTPPLTAESTVSKLLWRPISQDVKYLLFTAYIVPWITPQSEWSDRVIVTVNEAAVHDSRIVTGWEIANPIISGLSNEGLDELIQSSISVTSSTLDNRGIAFFEQRSVPFSDELSSHNRSKRCVEDFIQGITSLTAWWWEMLFGAPSICSSLPQSGLPAPQIDLVPVRNQPTNIDLSVYEADEIQGGDVPDFEVAMGVQFCNDRPPTRRTGNPEDCTLADRDAIRLIGNLSLRSVRELIQNINDYHADSAAGAAAPLHLTTGNAQLDAWMIADPERAANALSSAASIAQVSDSRANPEKPNNMRQRKKKVVKASCAENNAMREASEQGWECVRKAKRKLKRQDDVIAVPPQLQTGGRYYLAGRSEFDVLVRTFLRPGPELPAGIRSNEFAGLTAAIAHDGASTGDNLGIVYLNNPVNRGRQRFPFGLNHIWAPGGGGGDQGHREDWRALSVNSASDLTRVIMAALTDVHAQYTQTRTADGKVVRTYRRFSFMDGGRQTVYQNVRIVLRQNGMVVTAFPLKNAKQEVVQLNM
ncbi:hypothetical protein P4S52_09575 [Vibrio sp. SA48]|uniref:hypothetical protein n=1 Tax=Vibrio sp. S12_S33 TaxID=2720223 RepID=UPI00178763AC|nr:hypothetical protein [Vibrio sp. S12_S33]MBD1567185.1 hypothetical protein [Vibrio sp. S12_S33]